MKKEIYSFAKLISELIGHIDPAIIADVINISNEQTYIVHGIKSDKNYKSISEEGIKPLTPEGGYASFWTSGRYIFGNSPFKNLITIDTSFFDYAGREDSNIPYSYMNLAVAKHNDLDSILNLTENPKDHFSHDGYLTIHKHIPGNLIHLIRIEVECNNPNITRYEYARIKERLMLKEMHRIFQDGYIPGSLTRVVR